MGPERRTALPGVRQGLGPRRRTWVERIYYAGGADAVWGPYTIGYLEWDGRAWLEQPEPAFTAAEAWQHGSVYEPNLVYADGLWKMWFVFFDGAYSRNDGSAFPYVFTLGCLEIDRPAPSRPLP